MPRLDAVPVVLLPPACAQRAESGTVGGSGATKGRKRAGRHAEQASACGWWLSILQHGMTLCRPPAATPLVPPLSHHPSSAPTLITPTLITPSLITPSLISATLIRPLITPSLVQGPHQPNPASAHPPAPSAWPWGSTRKAHAACPVAGFTKTVGRLSWRGTRGSGLAGEGRAMALQHTQVALWRQEGMHGQHWWRQQQQQQSGRRRPRGGTSGSRGSRSSSRSSSGGEP